MNDNHGGEWGNWGPTVGLHQVKSSSLSYRVARCQLSSLMSRGSFIVLNSLQYQNDFFQRCHQYHFCHDHNKLPPTYVCCYRPGQGVHIRKGPTQEGTLGAEVRTITGFLFLNNFIFQYVLLIHCDGHYQMYLSHRVMILTSGLDFNEI